MTKGTKEELRIKRETVQKVWDILGAWRGKVGTRDWHSMCIDTDTLKGKLEELTGEELDG